MARLGEILLPGDREDPGEWSLERVPARRAGGPPVGTGESHPDQFARLEAVLRSVRP